MSVLSWMIFLSVTSQALSPPHIHRPAILPHSKMCSLSPATASVMRDLTLDDEPEIANCFCVLVATQGDGTPFSPDSFQEEDKVKLCMGLGHAHLGVVLQLLDTETVFTFCSGSKMGQSARDGVTWPGNALPKCQL